jgi:hypothetical protein
MTSWLDIVKQVANGIADSSLPQCPECGNSQIDYLYVGSEQDRTGYLLIWCVTCRVGVRISRARAPVGARFITFAEAEGALAHRVPDFRELPPR